MRYYLLARFFAIVFLFSRCAQIGLLSGGEPDRIAPVPLEFMPAQKALNFNDPIITITFNEHIQLQNAAAQVRMMPKVDELPELSAKGKTLIINLAKTKLQPNTTYRIEFGTAIADLTEKNAVKNLEYVFSTGARIDTIQLSGKLKLAEDNTPATDVLVGLYEPASENDSILYKSTPIYYSTTDNAGAYSFRNLPNRTFFVAAIADKNKNQLYDGETERLAFYADKFKLEHDSVLDLSVFAELPAKTFVMSNTAINYGKQLIKLNQKQPYIIRALDKRQSNAIFIENPKGSSDSIAVYYYGLKDTLALVLGEKESTLDTVYTRIPSYRKRALPAPDVIVPAAAIQKTDAVVLRFSAWMDTSKAVKLFLRKALDSTSKLRDGKWQNIHDFKLNATLLPGTAYTLTLPKGSFIEMQGNSCDSLNLNFTTKKEADFGRLKLKLRFKTKQQYLIQLVGEQNKLVQEQKVYLTLSGSNLAELDFKGLQPGTYKVKIIYDTNENGKWDTGNFLKRQQPEKVLVLQKQIKVLADWDTEEELDEK